MTKRDRLGATAGLSSSALPVVSTAGHASRGTRRGLATVELVLALPLLLMVMALMINYGTVAAWKVRSLSVSRNAVFSTRWPRTGSSDPRPPYWPDSANISNDTAGNVSQLDTGIDGDWVARGPLPIGGTCNNDLLNPARGLRVGSADMTRGYPMLGKLGSYRLSPDTYLLDDKWQYQRMGMGSNTTRRTEIIYQLDKAPTATSNAYVQAFVQLYMALMTGAQLEQALAPLDHDYEWTYWSQRVSTGRSAPNFHPSLLRFCTLDSELIDDRVTSLIDRIQGRLKRGEPGHVPSVAETMATAFKSLYQTVIDDLKTQNPVPPMDQNSIQDLEQKIQMLDKFLATQ